MFLCDLDCNSYIFAQLSQCLLPVLIVKPSNFLHVIDSEMICINWMTTEDTFSGFPLIHENQMKTDGPKHFALTQPRMEV